MQPDRRGNSRDRRHETSSRHRNLSTSRTNCRPFVQHRLRADQCTAAVCPRAACAARSSNSSGCAPETK
jgi:hypothetical protein